MTSNPYVDYRPPGRRPMRTRVVTSDAAAPMKPTAQEKDQRDKSTQLRLYRERHREELDVARNGEWGTDIRGLEYLLRKLTMGDTEALIELIKNSSLPKADVFTRYTALRLVGDRIERLRIQNGLPPFDDSLPDEPPTVFEIIRAELGVP